MRDIDRIIQFVRDDDRIPPVHRQVLITRIERPPTQHELDAARRIVELPACGQPDCEHAPDGGNHPVTGNG